jgi:hypothetical protein
VKAMNQAIWNQLLLYQRTCTSCYNAVALL